MQIARCQIVYSSRLPKTNSVISKLPQKLSRAALAVSSMILILRFPTGPRSRSGNLYEYVNGGH